VEANHSLLFTSWAIEFLCPQPYTRRKRSRKASLSPRERKQPRGDAAAAAAAALSGIRSLASGLVVGGDEEWGRLFNRSCVFVGS